MIRSSQHHINSLISNKCNQSVGGANQFLDQNFRSTNTGIQTNDSNANCVFNHQICDEISRLRLDNANSNTNQISSELNLVHNRSPESNPNENMHNSKSSYKKIHKNVHDPNINTVITSSTLKYAAIAFLSLFSICAYLSFIVIGILGLEHCGNYKKIPIYLLTFGIVGILHIFIYFSCPFKYSKSIVAKMYEHLIWRLVINRFSASLFLSNLNSASLYENSDKSYSDLSPCSKFNVKLSCCSTFFLNFFLCDCCCFSCCKGLVRKVSREAHSTMHPQPSLCHISETSLNLSRNLAHSNSSSMARFNASLNSISNKSDNTSERIRRRDNTFQRSEISSGKASVGTVGSRIKRGRNPAQMSQSNFRRSKSSSEINLERKKQKRAKKRAKSLSDNSLGNHYFNGRYGNKYSTHKHLYRHHKKSQKPFKLVDCHTMRFFFFFWVRQSLLLFLLVWFICGNYWVFNPEFGNANTNSTNKSQQKYLSKDEILRSLSELKSDSLNPVALKFICYDYAFYHIIVFYCIFAFTAVVIVIFGIFYKSK